MSHPFRRTILAFLEWMSIVMTAMTKLALESFPIRLRPEAYRRWRSYFIPTCAGISKSCAKVWANGTDKPPGCSTSGNGTIVPIA